MSGLVVDLFAGAGGASTGLEAALGRDVDIAINHDPTALAVHAANHPSTKHMTANIWAVDPLEATQGRPVDVLWASPDCTHFSVAKGAAPRKQNIRSLAWAVVRWATAVKPAVIFLENVSEFQGWGPLGRNRRPDKSQMGKTFKRWAGTIRRLGYELDYRVLDASLYGAPTKRKRLFLIARRDGQPIVWPEATHGVGKIPLHTAAECIDFDLACPSIFERKRPLAPKTLWRIAQGIKKFVLENPDPFIVRTSNTGTTGRAKDAWSTDEPLRTITARGSFGVIAPNLIKVNHGKRQPRGESLQEPLSTVVASRRGHALVTPSLLPAEVTPCPDEPERWHIPDYCVNRKGLAEYLSSEERLAPVMMTIDHAGAKSRSTTSAKAPLPTTTTENRHALIVPHIMKFRHDSPGAAADAPMPTVTAGGKRVKKVSTGNPLGVCVPTLIQVGYGERKGQAARVPGLGKPLGTIVAGGGKHALAAAALIRHYGGKRPPHAGRDLKKPLPTITAADHHSLAAATLVKLRGQCHGADLKQPMPTVTAKGQHVAEVRAFLTAFYGTDGTVGKGQSLKEPTRTITAKARLGLVTVEGVDYQIADIGMRMLQPDELLRAQFGRFAGDYNLSAAKTKSEKVRMIGNSVCPEIAEAIVNANYPQKKRAQKVA